jgi:hypothetical protein
MSPSTSRSRTDHRLAVHDPPEGVDDECDVGNSILEEVPDALGLILDEAHRVARFDVLREHEDTDLGMVVADRAGRDETLVRVGRWHADVHDGDVRPHRSHVLQQGLGVLRLRHDVDARVPEQPHDARSREHHVVGDDYPHGNSARMLVDVNRSSQPTAPTLSARAIIRDVRVEPSSRAPTTSMPPSSPCLQVLPPEGVECS